MIENEMKETFEKAMEEAVDLAECVFVSEEERKRFINDDWENYGDDIQENVNGQLGDENDWSKKSDKEKYFMMANAIGDNCESLFGKSSEIVFGCIQ